MSRPLRRVLCALLCLCLLSCPSFAAAFADGGRERPELEDVRVYVCSLLSGRAYLNGDTVYMSLSTRKSILCGAAYEARTRYLHLGKVALYRMS